MNSGHKKSRTILLADNHPDASAVSSKLTQAGYTPVLVSSGEAAAEQVRNNPDIDIVLIAADRDTGTFHTDTARKILEHRFLPIVFIISDNGKETVCPVKNIEHYGYIARSSGKFILDTSIKHASLLFKTCQKSIQDHLNEYKILFRNMVDGYATFEIIRDENGKPRDYRYTDVNPAFEKLSGFSKKNLVGKIFPEIVQESANIWYSFFHQVIETGKPQNIVQYSKLLNKHLKVTAFSPAENQLVTISRDITEQINDKKILTEQKKLLEQIMETSPVGISILDNSGNITFANTAAEKILGLSRSDITSRTYNDTEWKIKTVEGEDFPQEELPFLKVMSTGQAVYDIRHSIEWPDGKTVILSINGAPLVNPAREPEGVVITMFDITELVYTDKQINYLLKEKDLLMKEIHHRVKNDFTIVRSLLQWQADRAENEKATEILEEASNRVSVMADIYSILLNDPVSIHELDLDKMIKTLMENLKETIITENIKITTQLETVTLKSRSCINLSIIINELLTNAVKYAFRGIENPEILILLSADKSGRITLVIKDNGTGIPFKLLADHNYGFGLTLAETLVMQLNGELAFNTDSGTEITLSFSPSKD